MNNTGYELLISWYEKCDVYKQFHDESYDYCKLQDEIITLPIIIINTIAGSISFISLSFTPHAIFWTTIIVGILTILSSTLSGFKDYYTWKEQAIHHKTASQGYLKLKNLILILMAKHKMGSGSSYNDIISEVGKLLGKINNESPEFPFHIKQRAEKILNDFTTRHINMLNIDTENKPFEYSTESNYYKESNVIEKYSNVKNDVPNKTVNNTEELIISFEDSNDSGAKSIDSETLKNTNDNTLLTYKKTQSESLSDSVDDE